MRNHQIAPRRENEFFAFFGLRLGRERKWAESFCSLPSRVATRDGAQVGLHRSLILRTGPYTIARLAHHFLSGLSKTNVKESRWTFSPRKSGHFKPRFCGHLFPLLTPRQQQIARPPQVDVFKSNSRHHRIKFVHSWSYSWMATSPETRRATARSRKEPSTNYHE